MSQDEPELSARKAKRAQRDAERAEKHRSGKKRKLNESVNDLPNAPDDSVAAAGEKDASDQAPQTASSTSKKRKRTKDKEAFVVDTEGDTQLAQQPQANPSKKRRKQAETADEGAEGTGKKRFVVFVGNLPYSTKDDSLDKHFARLKPFTLRHRTDPKTKKSKGFAFIEFENYDRLKTCLKLYHHSLFDPENPGLMDPTLQDNPDVRAGSRKKSKGRRINVELTAGGGGTTDVRKEKIRVKNVRLEEQRTRRIEAERKEKQRKSRKDAIVGEPEKVSKQTVPEATSKQVMDDIHPSRRARMH